MTSDDEADSPGRGDRPREPEVEEAFDRLVSEGSDRLARPLVPLIVTGFVGGIDVGVGVLAYLVVDHETGQPLLAAAAFPIGFIALLLARSEAGYTWADWARALAWSGLGNLVGGVGLVTSIRLLRTPHRVAEERNGPS